MAGTNKNIEHVDHVDIPELGDLENVRRIRIEEMKADGEVVPIKEIYTKKDGWIERVSGWSIDLISGRNKTGKLVSKVVDVLGLFIPQVGIIDRLTTTVKNTFFKPKQNKAMATKKKTQSKTWWGILTVILSSLLGAYGIAADPSFLSDGFQLADDLEVAIAFIGTIAGWGLERWGQRTATQEVK